MSDDRPGKEEDGTNDGSGDDEDRAHERPGGRRNKRLLGGRRTERPTVGGGRTERTTVGRRKTELKTKGRDGTKVNREEYL